ncbi:DEAD/DEAH box helicase [Sphingobium chlorophenolicum]|uniref:Type III restriction enzyme, res subunit n=1 Tax=Sphingobium chlorophenolicum TaxID=46429 RepID=A0A081R8C8_SPHCR|nr:DEAD/DEAH box helicase family protein [Sphingobium chlorophenolicum]KEQ51451.1 Type III restriction enzyme, res subunit [Sphingobium chlorophenolicum]
MTADNSPLVSLAGYQRDAVTAIVESVATTAEYQTVYPEKRQEIARRIGAVLLEAPTGSGKTLILGRGLEALRGKMDGRCVWFWFAPFSGLITQTREALAQQCPGVRLRDITRDRSAAIAADGDVFLQTWALVATNRTEGRRVRTAGEDGASLDEMLADLRAEGFRIGVVIDEAHLNFGANAQAAANFYLNVLKPDFTLLATATPNDAKLEEFETLAGVTVENRIIISRQQAVDAGLNKFGLMLGLIRLEGQDAALIDTEQAALTVAWRKHVEIRERLTERQIEVTPLMLVQVEDQSLGSTDPIARVKAKLLEIGVVESMIAVHTSGEPDPDFHSLAFDPSKEVLIFKVAAATGFDAPRAWTLVSVRPTRGTQFGLQVVGRIMRVHKAVRPIHGDDRLLDRGYVFLTDPNIQAGLDAAAEELRAVRTSISSVADELQVLEFTSAPASALGAHRSSLPHAPTPPKDNIERQLRLESLISSGLIDEAVRAAPTDEQDRILIQAEYLRTLSSTPLFGEELPEQAARPPMLPTGAGRTYQLRRERGIPERLRRERLPAIEELDGRVVQAAARAVFAMDINPSDYLGRVLGRANVSLRDLFLEDQAEETVRVRMSDTRIAQAAQQSFEFNEAVSARAFKQALMAEFIRRCDERGIDTSDPVPLRRAIDLFALSRPSALPEALKQAVLPVVEDAGLIPPLQLDANATAVPSRLGAYDIFPPNMNRNERRFAELLDADTSGVVKWWLRLQENSDWAVTIMLPTGRRC